MPLHDWTRVDPNDYHGFHVLWLGTLSGALNQGILPDGYIALPEHAVPGSVPDILTMREDEPAAAGGGGGAVAVVGRATARAKVQPAELPPARRVTIRHARGRGLVAVVELLSPSNKADTEAFGNLLRKSVEFVEQRISLLVIDPFPPGPGDPHGFHAAYWAALTQRRAARPPRGKPLTVASYAPDGKGRCAAYVTPLAAGDPLPSPPLFLRPGLAVRVPLAASYDAAVAMYPATLVRRLGTGSPA